MQWARVGLHLGTLLVIIDAFIADRTTYLIEAPAPAPAPIFVPAPEPQVIERRTEIIVGSPPPPPPIMVPMEIPQSVRDWDVMSGKAESRHESLHESRHHESHHESHKRSPSTKSRKSRRKSSPSRSEYEEEERGNVLVLPERRNPERIKAEIRALEAEKKALKYEREMDKEHKKAEQYREGDIIIEKGRDVVKIEKDRKGRMSLVH